METKEAARGKGRDGEWHGVYRAVPDILHWLHSAAKIEPL